MKLVRRIFLTIGIVMSFFMCTNIFVNAEETEQAIEKRMTYKENAKTITVYTTDGKKWVYQKYNQRNYNKVKNWHGYYGRSRGCAITSTALVLNALVNKNITPNTVHQATSKNKYKKYYKYSEQYAINKTSNYSKLDGENYTKAARIKKIHNCTPTNMMINRILKISGLKTKYVYNITASNAEKCIAEIKEHLLQGNPVIFTTSGSRECNGIKMAGKGSWHTMTMLGIDKDDKVLVFNTSNGKLNVSHRNDKKFKFTVEEIVNTYLVQKKVGTPHLYKENKYRYGYILVSK